MHIIYNITSTNRWLFSLHLALYIVARRDSTRIGPVEYRHSRGDAAAATAVSLGLTFTRLITRHVDYCICVVCDPSLRVKVSVMVVVRWGWT